MIDLSGPRQSLHGDGLSSLVRADSVHRSLYLDPDIFALEQKRLFRRAWLYVGHDSQIPEEGDFFTCNLAGVPVIMLRREDGAISVLHNRCAHKGTPVISAGSGRIARVLRCPYHGWTYHPDGRLAGLPIREGYEGTAFLGSEAARGLRPWGEVASHRGFVFARAESDGRSLAQCQGELLDALDLLADRSPQGKLRVSGGVFRTEIRANWKVYLENINDSVHPVTTHASATLAARSVWSGEAREGEPPLAIRQLLPFGSGYSFFEQMGGRILPEGHSLLGTRQSLHTSYAALGDYGDALRAAHGEERTEAVLAFSPQNVVFYPLMALKGAPQVMRVLRPIAVDRTVLEAWAFQPVGAPDSLLESALLYNRQVFSPLSIVAHDDLHLFESIQDGLGAGPDDWVSLHREARSGAADLPRDVGGIDEALIRNQYAAWLSLMQPDGGRA